MSDAIFKNIIMPATEKNATGKIIKTPTELFTAASNADNLRSDINVRRSFYQFIFSPLWSQKI